MKEVLEKMRKLGYKDAQYDQFAGLDFSVPFKHANLHFNGKQFSIRMSISYISPELMPEVINELETLQRQTTELNECLWRMRMKKDLTFKTVSATCPDCGKSNAFNIPSTYSSIKDSGVPWFQCTFCLGKPYADKWLEGGDTNDQ